MKERIYDLSSLQNRIKRLRGLKQTILALIFQTLIENFLKKINEYPAEYGFTNKGVLVKDEKDLWSRYNESHQFRTKTNRFFYVKIRRVEMKGNAPGQKKWLSAEIVFVGNIEIIEKLYDDLEVAVKNNDTCYLELKDLIEDTAKRLKEEDIKIFDKETYDFFFNRDYILLFKDRGLIK